MVQRGRLGVCTAAPLRLASGAPCERSVQTARVGGAEGAGVEGRCARPALQGPVCARRGLHCISESCLSFGGAEDGRGDNDALPSGDRARASEAEACEEAMRQLKEATGAADANAIIQQFLNQTQTQEHLLRTAHKVRRGLSPLRLDRGRRFETGTGPHCAASSPLRLGTFVFRSINSSCKSFKRQNASTNALWAQKTEAGLLSSLPTRTALRISPLD